MNLFLLNYFFAYSSFNEGAKSGYSFEKKKTSDQFYKTFFFRNLEMY
jgi:hypothetical protein